MNFVNSLESVIFGVELFKNITVILYWIIGHWSFEYVPQIFILYEV